MTRNGCNWVCIATVIIGFLLAIAIYFWFTGEPSKLPSESTGIPIPEEHIRPYDRREWSVWIDADRDCQNTRTEVLIRDALAYTLSDNGCTVEAGEWIDPYTGRRLTNPREIDIDHVIPLEEASESGASLWSRDQKRDFANDLSPGGNLLAIHRSENRSKGSKSPDEWMPTNAGYTCTYITTWIALKRKWKLSADEHETRGIERLQELHQCP